MTSLQVRAPSRNEQNLIVLVNDLIEEDTDKFLKENDDACVSAILPQGVACIFMEYVS